MLREEAILSSQIYLNYLIEHREEGLGLVRARVRGIQGSFLDDRIVLITDRIIKSSEGIIIRINDVTYENTQEKRCFAIISISKRKVTIEPNDDLKEEIESAWTKGEPIILESDLTFLVKRVKEWYEAYGERVALPTTMRKRESRDIFTDNLIELSENQYECAMLAMTTPLVYIWGAPGTGKTKRVLASCISDYIRMGKKIILVAPTNNALEQSLSGLLLALSNECGIDPVGKVIRLGVPSDTFHRVWKGICEDGASDWLREKIINKRNKIVEQNRLIDKSLAFREGQKTIGMTDPLPDKNDQELKDEKKRNSREISLLNRQQNQLGQIGVITQISEFNVIAATVDTCLYRIPPDEDFVPDHIFLDEAGYCNVIKAMTLLGFRKPLTMLGDHMQLPPVFEGENDLLQDSGNRLARLWKISSLYMEEIIRSDDLYAYCEKDPIKQPRMERMNKAELTETYRFGPELAKVLAKRIYGPRFCSRSERETKIFFINAPKRPEDKGKDEFGKYRRISQNEVDCIRDLIETNIDHSGVTIGAITPYRNQRQLLTDAIGRLLTSYKSEDDPEDDIVTVHQSQGREWDIILFSITDCFDEKHFTNSQRIESLKLINTAVSRAKKTLILVGDVDDWKGKNGQLISELLEVGTEISSVERIVETVIKMKEEEIKPWEDNLGSLYFNLI